MKKIITFPFIVLLSFCGSQKPNITSNSVINSPCPENGECTFEVLSDKSLIIKTDGTGKIYYQKENTPGKAIVKYTYSKKSNPAYQDDVYNEIVVFEVDKSTTEINLEGPDIQKVKMLLGIQCFCREKAGYYTIKEGSIKYNSNTLSVIIPELVEGQLTKNISVTFK